LCVILLFLCFFSSSCFFFFQAEDGIRDFHVTGVQTCALPICSTCAATTRCCYRPPICCFRGKPAMPRCCSTTPCRRAPSCWTPRSEERRVGKECRSRR